MADGRVSQNAKQQVEEGDDDSRRDSLIHLSRVTLSRYEQSDLVADLDQAVAAAIEAARITLSENLPLSYHLSNLSMILEESFTQRVMTEHLETAIETAELAVVLTTERVGEARAYGLHFLSCALLSRFEQKSSLLDLDRAVTVASQSVDCSVSTRENIPNLARRLGHLARGLLIRFEVKRGIDDLNQSIAMSTKAANLTPDRDSHRAGYLNTLGNALQLRSEWTGSIDDLRNAVAMAYESIDCKTDPHFRYYYYSTLGAGLFRQFKRMGSVKDLNDAINACEEALNLVPNQHDLRLNIMNQLGVFLQSRSKLSSELADLNRAVNIANEVIEQTAITHYGRGSRLNNLGKALAERYQWTGDVEDLEAGIAALEEAVSCISNTNANAPAVQNTLGILLLMRYDRIGSANDLIQGIAAIETAAELTPTEQANRPMIVNNRAITTDIDNSRLSTEELTQRIEEIDQTLQGLGTNHQLLAYLWDSRSTILLKRFRETQSMDDLSMALMNVQSAIECTSLADPILAQWVYSRSVILLTRFEQTQSLEDLNEAIFNLLQSLELMQVEGRCRAIILKSLGNALIERAKQTRSGDDVARAVTAYEEAVYASASPPVIRITAAYKAVKLLDFSDLPRSSQILRIAVELFPTVNIRALENEEQDFKVRHFAYLINMAVAHCIQSGGSEFEALRLFELGRGVLAGLQLDLRTDISGLEDQHPALAKEFVQLRNELNSDPLHQPIQQTTGSQSLRYTAAKRFESLVKEIRELNGFERFLLGPSEGEFLSLAASGPIIIFNVARVRSDAFLVNNDKIRCLALPKLLAADVEHHAKNLLELVSHLSCSNYSRVNKELLQILEWLWDVAVEPILNALGYSSCPGDKSKWPHVWWIASGWLNTLPIHAAGHYANGQTANALDRVISSYTPTIRGLAFAREKAKMARDPPRTPEALFAYMPETQNYTPLPGTVNEIERIVNVLPDSIPKHFLMNPTKTEVESHLQTCQIAHFACHGETAAVLPRLVSALPLRDWQHDHFNVESVLQLKLKNPQLAYLSACQTASTLQFELLDEYIHLAGAFQLAGFSQVIATLWRVDDTESGTVAEEVYRTMNLECSDRDSIDITAAAKGLHRAVRRLRDMEVRENKITVRLREAPVLWAPYIHMGS